MKFYSYRKGREKIYKINEKFHSFEEQNNEFSISQKELLGMFKNLTRNQKGFIYKIIPFINSINSYICLNIEEDDFENMNVLSQEELATVIKIDPDTVAKHANALIEENILLSKRNGKTINYIFNQFKELDNEEKIISELEEKIEQKTDNNVKIEKAKNRRKKRAELLQELPFNVGLNGNKTWKAIFKDFGEECALSGEKDEITWDHFIPVDVGQGGTIIGNISPITRRLNSSKNSKHPIKWLEDGVNKGIFTEEKVDNLIRYLAKENSLSVEEFKEYINWCIENPRTPEDVIKSGNKSSIELWKSTLVPS